MFNNEELKNSPEYWLENVQNEIYYSLKTYMADNNLNQTQLAIKLGFSKSYISQILSGEFNYSIKKFIELSLALKQEPVIKFKSIDNKIEIDNCKVIDLKGYSKFDIYKEQSGSTFPLNKEILINEYN